MTKVPLQAEGKFLASLTIRFSGVPPHVLLQNMNVYFRAALALPNSILNLRMRMYNTNAPPTASQ